jgi:glycosyltransferase involved in cell wall biosynthesis
VVDDASTDDTPHVVRWLARRSNVPVRLLQLSKRSGGPAAPLNVGIHAAVAPLVATLDHDDAMLPHKLEQQVACLAACPGAGAVITRVHIAGYELGGERKLTLGRALDLLPRKALGASYYRIAAEDAYEALLTHGCFWHSCSNFLFPKAVFDRCGPFIERLRLNADYGFIQNVAKSYDIALVDEVLLEHHLEPEGLFRASPEVLKSTETLFVLRRFDRRRLSPEGRKIARRRLLRELWHFVHCDRSAPLRRTIIKNAAGGWQ